MHVNQRFRFNYVLGNGPLAAGAEEDDEDDEDDVAEQVEEDTSDEVVDLDASNELLKKSSLAAVRTIASATVTS